MSDRDSADSGDSIVHFLCLGCGELQPEGNFPDGWHLCHECNEAGRDEWRENPDGDGFVRREETLKEQSSGGGGR